MARNTTNKDGIVPGSPDDYILDTYANIPKEEPSFIWEPYFPSSAITVITGYPGVGKSSIALDSLFYCTMPGMHVNDFLNYLHLWLISARFYSFMSRG